MAQKTKKQALQALNRVIKQMKSQGARIGFASDTDFEYTKEPTPFPSVNGMIGGGLPRGKLTVISGPPGSCKSTYSAQCLAFAQARDPDLIALWVDVEHCWDPTWMKSLGVDVDRVIVAEMLENLEETLDLVIGMCREKAVGYIVYDSIGSISPKGEYESKKGEARLMTEDTVGLTARQFNKFLRIATPKIARADCVVILIAQVYSTIGIYSIEVVKGGNGIGHHAHLRLIMRRMTDETKKVKLKMPGAKTKSVVLLGWNVNIKVDKSKQSGTEGYSVILPFNLGAGIMVAEAAVITAIQTGLIRQAGSWYFIVEADDDHEELRVQGKQKVIDYYMGNDEAFAELTTRLENIAAEEMVSRIVNGDFTPESDEDDEDKLVIEDDDEIL